MFFNVKKSVKFEEYLQIIKNKKPVGERATSTAWNFTNKNILNIFEIENETTKQKKEEEDSNDD